MNAPCPKCGQVTDAEACANCGHALTNGAVKPPCQKPPLPPELAGYVFEKMPPEIEALLGPVNEEAYIEALREFEENGETDFEAFLAEIEESVRRRD